MTWWVTRWVCIGWVSPVMLTYTQSSTVPAVGVSVGVDFSKSRPLRFRDQFAVCGLTSLRVMKRALAGVGRSALRPGRLAGTGAGLGWLTVAPTRICITG